MRPAIHAQQAAIDIGVQDSDLVGKSLVLRHSMAGTSISVHGRPLFSIGNTKSSS